MKNSIKQVIIENKINGERFIYDLPFSYENVTYGVDIKGQLIAIEQVFEDEGWSHEHVYAVTNENIFVVTIIETEDLLQELKERLDSAIETLEIAKSKKNLLIAASCEQEINRLYKEIDNLKQSMQ